MKTFFEHRFLSAATPPRTFTAHYLLLKFVSLVVFFTLSAIFACPVPSSASEPFTGKIVLIDSGSGPQILNIVRAGKNGFVKAKVGDALFVGDTVKTGKGVKAQIELSDKSLINIGPEATLRVKAYVLKPEEAKRNYVLKALKGTIRFIISKAFQAAGSGATSSWKDSNVSVESTTAVAGVRGTDFVISVDTGAAEPSVEVAVLEGLVTVRSISLSVKQFVTLVANQVSTVGRGQAPSAAADLSADRRDALINETTPADTADLTNGKMPKQSKYTSGDVARDCAAGVALPEIMSRCASAGMGADQMVCALLDAGMVPYDVVYTAVTEGYPVKVVVAGAIGNGASLQEVIAAAMMGGAETRPILEGAEDAGAPAPAVASAVATAGNGDSSYGYSTPVPTVTSIIPQQPIVLGGGGGLTPSTQPASPYKPKPRFW